VLVVLRSVLHLAIGLFVSKMGISV